MPTAGVLPDNVADVAQIVCDAPAFAIVGVLFRTMETVDVEVPQLFEIAHWKIVLPTPSPVTPEFGEVGDVIVPEPETTVQLPVPTAGVLPDRVVVVAQTVCEDPAAEVVGRGLTDTV